MENQLPIQPNSSETTQNLVRRDKILNTVKENLNYIYIVLMIIANILLSLLTINGGEIGANYPKSVLGWVLWVIQILLQTLVGVLILNAFRRQGIQNGHKVIKDTYDKYLESLAKTAKIAPRSLKEYMSKQSLKDSLIKGSIYITLSILTVSVIIGANWNNLLSLVMNIILAIGFGLKAMLDAEEYVVTELVIWYQLKTAEVTDHKMEPAKEKSNVKLSGSKCKQGSTRTGRVQQKKEC